MPAAAKSTTTQPQAATQMSVMNAPEGNSSQHQHCEHGKHQKASRIRGGGAGKDCFLGMVGCFLCFGCPCEMCCEAATD
ncbi:hypothetical protein BJ165DRAFT_1358311 [Panaeolus papilionaceus]|nr:hypothetical protein BJ165DRAFT_1358311 [Panaeolus papilionaceus]